MLVLNCDAPTWQVTPRRHCWDCNALIRYTVVNGKKVCVEHCAVVDISLLLLYGVFTHWQTQVWQIICIIHELHHTITSDQFCTSELMPLQGLCCCNVVKICKSMLWFSHLTTAEGQQTANRLHAVHLHRSRGINFYYLPLSKDKDTNNLF